MAQPPTIFISAGEASGEAYGAQLIEAAKSRGGASFFGLGGAQMRDAGCDLVVDSHDVAVVGLAEVVRHLPRIYSRFRQLVREIDRRKPNAAVLIDFPDFNFRLAKELHKRGIPVVYYVSPQLWAWRQSRLQLVQKYVTKMLVIFPFEERWYQERGVEAEYVGHPLAFAVGQPTPPKLGNEKPIIALLPGSRTAEIERHAPEMGRVMSMLGDSYRFVIPIASTVSEKFVASLFEQAVRRRLDRDDADATLPIYSFPHNAQDSLRQARAAVVASGTATVEAALLGTPFVVIYRLSGLTWKLGRRMVKLEHFAMPNLIAGRRIVPELIQDDFTAENVLRELNKIIPDGPEREEMIAGLAEVRAKLSSSGVPPAERAARVVLDLAGHR